MLAVPLGRWPFSGRTRGAHEVVNSTRKTGGSLKTHLRILFCACLLMVLGGCAQLGYYAQAMQGQMLLLASAKPIDDWLADPQVEEKLKTRLRQTRAIRSFAASELALPDNGSYKNYADLKRPYVMWNVVATPELSLKPVKWCFPVAGCVDYRGYYNHEAAQAFADGLRAHGRDVRVSGVPAYSTLGWFNDPVLSTFIDYPEAEIARLVFHELAHQVAYAPGDSQFNESFATAVEELGVACWLDQHGDAAMRERYSQYRVRKEDFLALLNSHRQQLEANFSRDASDAEKRARKQQIFASMKRQYETLKAERWDGYGGYDRWFGDAISNAHFALAATYHDLVPGFRGLFAQEVDLRHFYAQVKAMAKLDKKQRRAALAVYTPMGSPVPAAPATQTVAAQ